MSENIKATSSGVDFANKEIERQRKNIKDLNNMEELLVEVKEIFPEAYIQKGATGLDEDIIVVKDDVIIEESISAFVLSINIKNNISNTLRAIKKCEKLELNGTEVVFDKDMPVDEIKIIKK